MLTNLRKGNQMNSLEDVPRYFALCRSLIVLAVFPFFLFNLIKPHAAYGAARDPHFHKFHVSVTQIEYNQKEQCAEITIRVFADDLENALSQHAKRRVKLDPATANKDKQVGETVLAYLRSAFEMKTKTGRPVKFGWVGMEWQADMFWLYVEGKLTNGLEGAQLRNKVFQELFDDQVNIVNSKIDGKQIGLMFDARDDFKMITALPPAK
jgi:hypothetical protein